MGSELRRSIEQRNASRPAGPVDALSDSVGFYPDRRSRRLSVRFPFEDDVAPKDRWGFGLELSGLLEERSETGVTVVRGVLRHAGYLGVDEVQGNVVSFLGPELDPGEARLEELALSAELIPDRQLFRLEEALELI
jgi:hypothetical protein